jgi:2-C-methyl-D-erythritol 4-phosphate cytidylyltransferase/2-C-methyl-D-erythritol 2,4-cyclodiphosphate synthase
VPGSKAKAKLRIAVVVTAAGLSERFGGDKKELLPIGKRSILDHAISPFLPLAGLESLVITAPAGREAELRAALKPQTLAALEALGTSRFAIVAGGSSRRDSVRLGLEALAGMLGGVEAAAVSREANSNEARSAIDDVVVLVHDGARPWASADLAARVARTAALRGAALPVAPLVDTPKELRPDGTVLRHLARAALGGAQTPQGFMLGPLLAAHRKAAADGFDCTDDAELWDRYIGPVASVAGESQNRKVTYAADLRATGDEYAAAYAKDIARDPVFRIGQGWDLHRLAAGRSLVLGGVAVPSELGEEAHSDGDVLLHAIIDALLGAAALGDIGDHFPPSDEAWRGADSRDLARRTMTLVREAGWEPGNIDCTVVLERPRLSPYKDAIRASLAECLGISPNAVSIKAKTSEGVDAVGEGRAVEASAVVLLFAAK